jgi:hypothetical protein
MTWARKMGSPVREFVTAPATLAAFSVEVWARAAAAAAKIARHRARCFLVGGMDLFLLR